MNNFQTIVICFLIFIAINISIININTTPKSEAILSSYPDWVSQTKQKCPDGLRLNNDGCVIVDLTESEKYSDFRNKCIYMQPGGYSWIELKCTEAIIDDRLAPINEKLDYIIYSNGYNCDHIFGIFNGTKCFETWKNKQ